MICYHYWWHLQENWWSWTKSFLGKCVSNNWWIDCERKKMISKSIQRKINFQKKVFRIMECIPILTSSSQFELSTGLCAFLIVANEALVHAVVFLFNRFNAKYSITVAGQWLAILHPWNRFDGISWVVASEHSRSTEINGLRWWIDFCRQWSRHSQYSFNTFTANRIVNHAQIFARIFNNRILNDQRARHLFYSIIQNDSLFTCCSLNEFIPSKLSHFLIRRKIIY